MPAPVYYDCQRCGACCVNPPENRGEGFTAYVEIEPTSTLLRKKDLVRKLVVLNDQGDPCMRLATDGRCMALKGAVGRRVECAVYFHRPAPCRRVEGGSKLCLEYRRAQGLEG